MAKKHTGVGAGAAVGAAAAAATAVAAIGAYWFYGAEHAARHRKSARAWMLGARAEVLAAVEAAVAKAGAIDRDTFDGIVKKVLDGYTKAQSATEAELAQVQRDMTDAWRRMQKMNKAMSAKAKSAAKKKKPAAKKK
jgi:hypothetical protein